MSKENVSYSNSRHITYSVIVPVYNSQESLGRLNSELHEVMDKLGESYELLYIDDCSPDASWQVLTTLQAQRSQVRIIRLAGNVGQLTALICGVQHSRGQHIITIDDDLEYNTFDIAKLVQHYQSNKYLIVYAMPTGKSQKNLSYQLFFNIRNWILNRILGKRPSEGFRIFNSRIMADRDGHINISIHLDAYDKLMLHRRSVGYIDVDYRPRPYGRSGHNVLKKIGIISKFGLEYLPSPLKLYIYIGLVLLAMSVVFLAALLFVPNKLEFEMPALWMILFHALVLIGIGVLTYYASSIHLRLKGRPDYIILDEL